MKQFICRHNGHPGTAAGGFTLIELLVVIGVIGILAGLLLPALSRAKERGRVTRCLSNQKQISVAITLYADEQEHYPPGRQAGFTQWDLAIGRYTGGREDPNSLDARTALFMCPSARIGNNGTKLNYSANPNVCKEILPGVDPVKANTLRRPTDTLLAADSIQYTADGNAHAILWGVVGSAGTPIYWNNGNSANGGNPIPVGVDRDQMFAVADPSGANFRYRHEGNSVMASFADGHAERMRKGKVLDLHLYTNY
jgi:prepilin-type N-terminal cleavage/methylation domain-containing protein/prepilin-type processing-associated H-X9-DG protein